MLPTLLVHTLLIRLMRSHYVTQRIALLDQCVQLTGFFGGIQFFACFLQSFALGRQLLLQLLHPRQTR